MHAVSLKSFYEKWKHDTEIMLSKNGVSYMLPEMSALLYMIVKIMCMVFVGIIAGITFHNVYLVFVLMVSGYFLPNIIIHMSNNSDNDEMMSDIESIYDIMRIQARAGVFVKDSLMDCYVNTINKRLKTALLDLCNMMSTNMTMEEAVDIFSSKFNNRHIDVLCIVLAQAQSSGKTVQILTDMSDQITNLRHSRAKSDEGKLERKIEIIELLIFIGVLAMGVFAMGNEISGMINL